MGLKAFVITPDEVAILAPQLLLNFQERLAHLQERICRAKA